MTRPRVELLVDGFDVGSNSKGITRVVLALVPLLHARYGDGLRVVATPAGRPILEAAAPGVAVTVVPQLPKSVYEQLVLPLVANRVGARIVYLHREAGPVWGPTYLLHMPEDPEVRWARSGPKDRKDQLRRRYHRAMFMRFSRRALVMSASTESGAQRIRDQVDREVLVTPLGVDTLAFHSVAAPARNFFLHMASGDPRDNTAAVCQAIAMSPASVMRIAGDLSTAAKAQALDGIDDAARRRIQWLGRVTDAELVELYANAIALVQPSSDEGFGLQPLEALACGTRSIVLETAESRETLGDTAFYLANAAPHDIAAALAAATDDRGDPLKLRARAEDFSWIAAEAKLARIIDDALARS